MATTEKVMETPCPRCGCHAAHTFECSCGAVHGTPCDNCGRFRELSPTEHVDLSPLDVRCDKGAVEHDHNEERKARLQDHHRELRDAMSRRS